MRPTVVDLPPPLACDVIWLALTTVVRELVTTAIGRIRSDDRSIHHYHGSGGASPMSFAAQFYYQTVPCRLQLHGLVGWRSTIAMVQS